MQLVCRKSPFQFFSTTALPVYLNLRKCSRPVTSPSGTEESSGNLLNVQVLGPRLQTACLGIRSPQGVPTFQSSPVTGAHIDAPGEFRRTQSKRSPLCLLIMVIIRALASSRTQKCLLGATAGSEQRNSPEKHNNDCQTSGT